MYNVGPYFMAKTLADGPVLFFTPLLATVIVYFGVNLHRSFETIAFFYLALVNIAWTASSLGYLLSSCFESETTATGLAPVIIMPMMLFGGLLANNERIPDWLGWLQYLSTIKYGSEALVSNELAADTFGLKENFLPFLDYNLGYRNCMFIMLALTIGCRLLAFIMFKSLVRKF
jgi:ABC-type multidrug transport system permease subunit